MDGSAVHRAAAVFTAAVCVRRGSRAAVGAGDGRLGRSCLLNLLTHVPANLRQRLSDFLAEPLTAAVLNIGLRVVSARHARTQCGRRCEAGRIQ